MEDARQNEAERHNAVTPCLETENQQMLLRSSVHSRTSSVQSFYASISEVSSLSIAEPGNKRKFWSISIVNQYPDTHRPTMGTFRVTLVLHRDHRSIFDCLRSHCVRIVLALP
jgi:hypothetical protein